MAVQADQAASGRNGETLDGGPRWKRCRLVVVWLFRHWLVGALSGLTLFEEAGRRPTARAESLCLDCLAADNSDDSWLLPALPSSDSSRSQQFDTEMTLTTPWGLAA